MTDDEWKEEDLWDKALEYAEALDKESEFVHGDLYEDKRI